MAPDTEPGIAFPTSSPRWYKANHERQFTGFPSDWTSDYCGVAMTSLCTLDGPAILRLSLSVGGTAAELMSVSVDGTRQLMVLPTPDAAAFSVTKTDAVISVGQGCATIELVFEDPGEEPDCVVCTFSELAFGTDAVHSIGPCACSAVPDCILASLSILFGATKTFCDAPG